MTAARRVVSNEPANSEVHYTLGNRRGNNVAQLFKEEKGFPDNAPRTNFVFLAYPYAPPLALDDYRALTRELEQELPLRLWYFLDEITTDELMRKVWRAILRCDLSVFDISRGNPNVAFELGLAVAAERPCITVLKAGAKKWTRPRGLRHGRPTTSARSCRSRSFSR